ncbi:MAG: ATP-binding protein [Phycisphaerae bacterium]
MTRLEARPWSQTLEPRGAAPSRPQPRGAVSIRTRSAPRGARRAWFDSDWLRHIRARWAAAPMAAALVWPMYEFFAALSPARSLPVGVVIELPLLLLAAGLLWAGRGARAAVDRRLEEALRAAASPAGVPEGADLPPEFAAVVTAVSSGYAELKARLAGATAREERQALERRLATLRSGQLEAVIDGIRDALVVTDEFDRLVLMNPAAEALLGVARSAALRRALGDAGVDEKLVRIIRQCREAGRSSTARHVELSLGERAVEASLASIDVHGERDGETARGVVCLLRDVTREKEVAMAKSDFVAKAAHELRTPLSSIKAYVEMLVDGEAADEKTRREYYETIQTCSDRLGRLIDNVLNISRIEAGASRINKEALSVAMVVKEVVDVARPQADAKGIELTAELTPVYYQVLADRDLITQAVLNLLSNAIKYTVAGGKVCVRMSANEDQQTITTAVSDTGAGIPEADLPRVFEKFFRVEQNKSLAKGTGLGLNLVRHIVETVHGGQVAVKSVVGQGSTFSMILPMQR